MGGAGVVGRLVQMRAFFRGLGPHRKFLCAVSRVGDPVSEMKDFMWSEERKGRKKRRMDQENKAETGGDGVGKMELEY